MKKAISAKKSLRQQEIVRAVRTIITEKGMESLTVRTIADKLGVTDGSLYRHFKSKHDILFLLIQEIGQTLLQAVDGSIPQGKDPVEKLERIFFTHLSYAQQRKGISFIVIMETINLKDRRLQRQMWGVIDQYLERIRGILKEGVRLGKFKSNLDIVTASVAFFGMIQSLVTIWSLSNYKVLLSTERLKQAFSIFKNGIER
jgi:AcrR family transcriptional regulator